MPAPKSTATTTAPGRGSARSSSRQPPITNSALPIVWARSNGVALCGATSSSQDQSPSAGGLPYMPVACWSARTGSTSERETWVASDGDAETAGRDGDEQAAVAEVGPPEREPDEQVGQPGDDRVVAGEQQLAGQPAGVGELAERRARDAALGQVRADDVRQQRHEHDPADRQQRRGCGRRAG